MWQIWFVAMFGLGAVFFPLGTDLNLRRDKVPEVSA
jgi:hypothetical protein